MGVNPFLKKWEKETILMVNFIRRKWQDTSAFKLRRNATAFSRMNIAMIPVQCLEILSRRCLILENSANIVL